MRRVGEMLLVRAARALTVLHRPCYYRLGPFSRRFDHITTMSAPRGARKSMRSFYP